MQDRNLTVFLSSSLKNIAQVRRMQDLLLSRGFKVLCSWINVPNLTHRDDMANICTMCASEVGKCDVFVQLSPGGRGSYFETGLAHGLNKPVLIVGSDNLGFQDSPGFVRRKTLESAVDFLCILDLDEK